MLPAVAAGVVSGSVVSAAAVVALARLAGLEKMIVVSLAPKSVTAPVAVEIARIIGGDQALTAAFVIATGVLGSMLGPWFLSLEILSANLSMRFAPRRVEGVQGLKWEGISRL